MRRFTIRMLMCVIGFVGVGVAALRSGSEFWARALLFATLALLAFSILGVAYREGSRHAWWFGFALFGWGYAALSLSPCLAKEVGMKLPTYRILFDLYQQELKNMIPPNAPEASRPGAAVQAITEAVVQLPPPTTRPLARPFAGFDEFVLIGQSLFALLAAFTGGLAALWMYKTRSAAINERSA